MVLCNSFPNYWFPELKLEFIPVPVRVVDFLPKNLKTIEARPLWYPSFIGVLAILNGLSCNTLSEAVPRNKGKSLKFP